MEHSPESLLLIYRLCKKLWSTTLYAYNNPNGEKQFDDMQNPQSGDLVFENSVFPHLVTTEEATTMIGILVARGSDQYLIKRLYDGQEMTWTNSEFLKVPIEIKDLLDE